MSPIRPGGYMGRFLMVDLSKGKVTGEVPDERLYRDFVGGYGIGVRVIFSRQKPGVDPLGPDNTLAFITGPLTGTPVLGGTRYAVVAKSPLTGTWGDANSGGDFGPYLKFAGYDAVFFSGASAKPVYLSIENGRAELRDAGHLWGKDISETEGILKGELGKEARVAAIGPAGEKLSLISCIMTGINAAGRSGLGAVMGSKKLKAVVVTGTKQVPIADSDKLTQLRRKYLAQLKGPLVDYFRVTGTPGSNLSSAQSGDTPVKNWAGIGIRDFPDAAAISADKVLELVTKKHACWRCPLGCGAYMKAGREYKYPAGVGRPEYQTWASFGTLCLNSNLESVIAANNICNLYGLDTISAGCTIAFAIECYQNGLITSIDTGGIELKWGNHRAIVAMTEKMAKREDFGDILADGVKIAAENIGKGSDKYAVHIGGQEIPMHDPKYGPGWATSYKLGATPGRHTEGGTWVVESGLPAEGLDIPELEKYEYGEKGKAHKRLNNYEHAINASGWCMFMSFCIGATALSEFMSTVTGQPFSVNDLLEVGERVCNLRHAFNIREGVNPLNFKVPDRILGRPPQREGPLKGVTVDINTLQKDYLKAMDWDPITAKPSERKLRQLGLEDVAGVLREIQL